MAASAGVIGAGAHPPVLRPGRLDGLVRHVARLYRKAHVTADEWRYVNKRVRQGLPLEGHRPRLGRHASATRPVSGLTGDERRGLRDGEHGHAPPDLEVQFEQIRRVRPPRF